MAKIWEIAETNGKRWAPWGLWRFSPQLGWKMTVQDSRTCDCDLRRFANEDGKTIKPTSRSREDKLLRPLLPVLEPTVQTQVFICASLKIVSNPLKSVTKVQHQVLAIEPKRPTAQLPQILVDFPVKNWNQIGYQNGHSPMEVNNSRSQIVVGNGIQIWPCRPVTFKPLIKFTQFHQMGEVFITNMCFLLRRAPWSSISSNSVHPWWNLTFRSHRKQSGCVDEPQELHNLPWSPRSSWRWLKILWNSTASPWKNSRNIFLNAGQFSNSNEQ